MSLPLDLWIKVFNFVGESSDAARLACVSADTSSAYRLSRAFFAPRFVRSSVDPDSGLIAGEASEPASGTFDVELSPGDSLMDAIGRCPRGGSVLLRPGSYYTPPFANISREVHVFGRRAAAIMSTVTLRSQRATFVGIDFRESVTIADGNTRLQSCTLRMNVLCIGGDVENVENVDPTFDRCLIQGRLDVQMARGLFSRCTIESVTHVLDGSTSVFFGNTFRNDHSGWGIRVDGSSPTFVSNDIQPGPAMSTADIHNNTVGINLRESPRCVITRNSIGAFFTGIQMIEGSSAYICKNELWNVRHNIALYQGSHATVVDNHLRAIASECLGIFITHAHSGGKIARNHFSWHAVNVYVGSSVRDVVVTDNVFRASKAGVCATSIQCEGIFRRNRSIDVVFPFTSPLRSNVAAGAVSVGAALIWGTGWWLRWRCPIAWVPIFGGVGWFVKKCFEPTM